MEAQALPNPNAEKSEPSPSWMPTLRAVLTILALLAFGIFIVFLLKRSDASERTWSHYVYLLTGVEAIVFAAVGWLFGRDVSRPVVEQAKEAGDAKAQAAEERTKGKTLAQAVLAQETAAPARSERLQAMGTPQAAAAAPDTAALAALARSLYPEAQ